MNLLNGHINKKRKIFLLFFSLIVVVSIPVSIGTYFLVTNKKSSKHINTIFVENNILPSVKIDADIWKKVKKNIFEDENEIYFKEKSLSTSFSTIYNNVLFIKKHNKKHDFTNLKILIQDINIRTLNLNDLYFFHKLLEELNVSFDKNEIAKILEKHWDFDNNLFFKDDLNDSYLFKLVITYTWIDYLKKNNSNFLILIKKNIENIVNSKSFFDKNNLLHWENKKHLFLLSSALEINLSTNLKMFKELHSDWKKEILKINSLETINFIKKSTFFLIATDNYFAIDNAEIKNKLIEIFNAADEKEIEVFVRRNIDFFVFQNIDIRKIPSDFFFKFSEISKKITNNFENFFEFKPNVEKTFYSLLTYNESEIQTKREKIINFLSLYDGFLDYLASEINIAQWITNVLNSEKIKFLVNYKKTEKEKIILDRRFQNILRQGTDYKTIFNILLIKLINGINTIPTDFYHTIKEIIMSYKQIKTEDKNNVTVYIFMFNKILGLNLIEEKELVTSLRWFLKNQEKLAYANKETIYYYFLTMDIIRNTDIKKSIKQLLKENRQKILNSENDEEKMFFIDSVLKSYFSNVIERKNNDTN